MLTNRPGGRILLEACYDEQTDRGESESRNKELKCGLKADRLSDELRQLPVAETIVCCCEDVRLAELSGHRSWRSAKLHTRCGMGPCQGRICGTATDFLLGWGMDSVRPPLYPVRVEHLAQATVTRETQS